MKNNGRKLRWRQSRLPKPILARMRGSVRYALGNATLPGAPTPSVAQEVATQSPITLNDIHSRLNATEVESYHEPSTKAEIVDLVREAADTGRSISISGGRHSMGGQQFGESTIHINLSNYSNVHALDRERGLVTVESGIQWPALIEWLLEEQEGDRRAWGIRQKQTGADKLSIGGALSSNIHSRCRSRNTG